MKFVAMLAVASMALTPAVPFAQSTDDDRKNGVAGAPGPIEGLPVLAEIPDGAVVVGGLIILLATGAVIGVAASGGGSSPPVTTTGTAGG